jgi:hypothetical protein
MAAIDLLGNRVNNEPFGRTEKEIEIVEAGTQR